MLLKQRFASTMVLAAAAAFLPGSLHASTAPSPGFASAALLVNDPVSLVTAIATTSGATPKANDTPAPCNLNDPSGCGATGVGGCSNSPENPTILLGVLGLSGLLVGRKTRTMLKKRTVIATA